MNRILLLTNDEAIQRESRAAAARHGWRLEISGRTPEPDAEPISCDLVVLDGRPRPDSRLTFVDVRRIMLERSIPLCASRVLSLGHWEPLVGRMNAFVSGGSAYCQIHSPTDAPAQDLGYRLETAILDALSLPAYEQIDFHDAFPDRDFYRQMLESVQLPIVLITNNGLIKLMNLRALARFDYSTHLVINQHWDVLIAPVDRGKRAEDFLIRISSGYFYEGALRLVDRQGKEFPALVSSSRVFSGEPESELLIVLAITDLTETEELQRQVSTLQNMESVERVVAGMTHEFNNMLTAILGHAELLTEDLPAGSEVHHSASVIRHEAERAQDLTGRLLGLSSTRQFLPSVISCNQAVRETVELLSHSLGDGIRFETDLLAGGDRIEGDPSQLRQVLVNLCLNARDAMDGKGVITLRTSVRDVLPEECRMHQHWTPGVFVEIAVRDTGCGIKPDVLSRVFEPFFTTKPAGVGTGLGLSVVRGMVKTHSGHVAIESTPGKGTTVMVRLPQAGSQADVSAGSFATPEVPLPRGNGEAILVVDDDRAVLTFAQKVLARSGFRVRLAVHGELALDVLDRHRDELSLIVLDMTMPGLTGREVVQEIRSRNAEIPVILCTGFAEGGVDDELVKLVQGFLKKPYRPRDLVEQVCEVLEASRDQQA